MEEVDAHNADNMKACPVHEELINRPGGYPYMPPILQIILEQAGLLKEEEPGEGDAPAQRNDRTGKARTHPTPMKKN